MNLAELLPIHTTEWQQNSQPSVNARNLHLALDVGRDFSTWIKARLKQADFIENQDYKLVHILSIDTPKRGNQKGGDKRSIDYFLTLDTAKHLCLMERNNPIAHAIRQHFIDSEKALQKIAPITTKALRERTLARIATIEPQKELTRRIEQWQKRHGKTAKPHHYIREAELINSIALGENVRKWKLAQGVKDNPRNYFNHGQLALVKRLTELNAAMIELDMNYHERKERLTTFANEYKSTFPNFGERKEQ